MIGESVNIRRVRKVKQYFLYGIISILGMAILIYLFTDYKFVGKINVEGSYYLDAESVIRQSGLMNDQLFLATDEHKIELLLEEHPIIEEAHITKLFPNRINIHVSEYTVVGCLNYKEDYYQVFSNSYTNKIDSLSSCKGPVITGINTYFYEELLEDFAEKFNYVDQKILSQLSEIVYSPNEFNNMRMVAYMTDGNQVLYSIDSFERLNYYNEMKNQVKLKYGRDVNGMYDIEIGAFFTPFDHNV